MINDPIVEEIHRIRQALLDECDGDLEKLMARFKASEEQDRDRLVTSASRRGSGQRDKDCIHTAK